MSRLKHERIRKLWIRKAFKTVKSDVYQKLLVFFEEEYSNMEELLVTLQRSKNKLNGNINLWI